MDSFIDCFPLEAESFFDLSAVEKPIERLEEPLYLVEETGYNLVTEETVIYKP